MARIHSRSSAVLKTVRLVAAQARRAPPGLVLAEGIRVLEEVLASSWPVELVLVSEGFGQSPRAAALVAECARRRLKIYEASRTISDSASDVLAPQGALALVRVPQRRLPQPSAASPQWLLCACGIQDPGNLGTLLRTARATGVSAACTTPGTVSPRNPKAIRASAGAFFHIPVAEDLSPQLLISHLTRPRFRIYRTSADQGDLCWDSDLRAPCAVVLGNESRGVGDETWRRFPCIRIPMSRGAESLNVAAAGAMIMYEAMRQRMSSGVENR